MQLAIQLDQAALDSYEALLNDASERALDAEPAMQRIAEDFTETERIAFATGGRSRIGAWEPDSTDWLTVKQRRGRGGRTMVYTGTLERSLIDAHAKYSLRVTGPGEVIVGTLDPVAHLQQSGTGDRYVKTRNGQTLRKPKYAGRLPRRVVAEILPTDLERWSGYVSAWLTGDKSTTVRVGL